MYQLLKILTKCIDTVTHVRVSTGDTLLATMLQPETSDQLCSGAVISGGGPSWRNLTVECWESQRQHLPSSSWRHDTVTVSIVRREHLKQNKT